MENKKNNSKIILVFLFLITISIYIFLNKNSSKSLVINEIAYSSEDGIDWIEIYNPTINNLSLENLYLSDKSKDFAKFQIQDSYTIPAGGFVVIYCKDSKQTTENSMVTNFRISKGETVYLIDKDGSTIIDSMTVPENSNDENLTIGRFPDGSNEIFIMDESTPGDNNIKSQT